MGAHLLVAVEAVAGQPDVWAYGQPGADGRLGVDAARLAYDPLTGRVVPLGESTSDYPTAALLVHRCAGRTRVCWDVTATMFPPSDPGRGGVARRPGAAGWERSTAGKAKGPGETLRQRSERSRRPPPS